MIVLCSNDFDTFFVFRAKALLDVIAKAVGKKIGNLEQHQCYRGVWDGIGMSAE